ncbi:MAG: S9 family peptidase [Vicinamibacterales bacterium]
MISRFYVWCVAVTLLVVPSSASSAQQAPRVPTIDDLLMLESAGAPRISPDGRWVAYTVTQTIFKDDAFVTQLWVASTSAPAASIQLTRGNKSSANPRWSPDSKWIAFTSDRSGDRNQVFTIRPDGGEAIQLTKSETPITSFDWSEDGKTIAYVATEPATKDDKDRKEQYGDFQVVRRDYGFAHLSTFTVAEALKDPVIGRQRTKGRDFSVGGFSWSPDNARLAFSATINPDLVQGATSDIYLLDLASDDVKKIVSQPGPDNNPLWSPDGKQIVFSSAMGKPLFFHANSRLAVVSASGGTPRSITDRFDEQPGLIAWTGDGIYFSGAQRTAGHLFRVDPAGASIVRVTGPDDLMGGGFSLTRDGKRMAFSAASPTTLNEISVSEVKVFSPRLLTRMTDQAKPFVLGSREMISWKSSDGTLIEGVLIKPSGFDPSKKYPLLCIIHGGPTGVDRPALLAPDARYYPADIWVSRGALVLKVNYRGSAGYGEQFRQLNVRNLGMGDAWDVLSGVDYLIAKGWVDPQRVASMGWSQGGYISAFLTTSSERFKAISVGAGISNWATYYYNTDITPFTIQYLGDDPVDDPEIYQKTSPMSYIKKARTPTLIQHGELDRRVPIANAYELRQGLEDRGVKAEMIVYKGFGHGITKPRSQRAVMHHNLAWFNHYLFGDPLPDLAALPIPKPPATPEKK